MEILSRLTLILVVLSLMIQTCSGYSTTSSATTATSGTTSSTTPATTPSISSMSQESSSLEQHAEDDPEIRFGNFFYVSFPKTIAEEFFRCLCDRTSLDCSVRYKLRDNQTSTDFPFLYRVISHHAQSLSANHSDQYRPYFVCDVLNFVPGQDIYCRRQLYSEQTCEATGKCQSYAANFTLPGCDMGCVDLAWLSAFTVPITYKEIDHLISVTENGTCPGSEGPEDDELGIEGGIVDNEDDNGLELPIILGIVVGSVMLVAVAAALVAWALCKRVPTRSKSKGTIESNGSKPAHPSGSQNGGFGEVDEEDQYQAIYDIPDGGRIPEQFDEPDEDGYNFIRDDTPQPDGPKLQLPNSSRSLPPLPSSEPHGSSDLTVSDGNPTSLGPSSLPPHYNSGDFQSFPANPPKQLSTEATSMSKPSTPADSASSSTSSTAMLLSRPVDPDSPIELNTVVENMDRTEPSTRATDSRPKPTPHKVSVPTSHTHHHVPDSTSHYDYLGLVNIRSGYPGFSDNSQFKLVKNTSGDISLIHPQHDTPAVEELCSGFQLISLRDGSLCVLGVLGEPPSDDYHKYFKILKVNNHYYKNVGDVNKTNSSLAYFDSERSGRNETLQRADSIPDMMAIYLGPLQLEEGYSVMTTETGNYLTFDDLETNERLPDDGTYLKVLDIDEANITDKDGDYLTVLDV